MTKPIFLLLPVIIFVQGGLFGMNQQKGEGVSVRQAYEMMENDSNVVVLDVRTQEEYLSDSGRLWFHEKGQKKEALLIPVQELSARVEELEPYRGRTILTYCRSGNRSGMASVILNKRGFRALNVEGGIVEWHKKKLPVIK